MSNIRPTQIRTIDPYSSYNSNVVNRLTRMVSTGLDCLYSTHAIDVTIDSTSPQTCLVVSSGQCFKDDVIIQVTEDFTVDMTVQDFYVDSTGGFWNEAGYYFIVLEYMYIKSKPAPEASIRIFMPSQIASYTANTDRYFFLKCVYVIFNGSTFEISSVHDWYPSDPTIRRVYSPLFAGVEDSLPTFDRESHEGKIVYVRNRDNLYFGTSARWEEVHPVRAQIDTTQCEVGQLGYIDSTGRVEAAIATASSTLASCVVLQEGIVSDGSGQVRLYGIMEGVWVETGINVTLGQHLYLSDSEAGSVTIIQPSNHAQYIGQATGDSYTSGGRTKVDIWFMPGGREVGEDGEDVWQSIYDKYQDMLLSSIFKRLTLDIFINYEYTDQVLTTTTLNTDEWRMDGESGDQFVSKNLVEAGYDGTNIEKCQLTYNANEEDLSDYITCYVSKDGGSLWEPTTPDDIHIFATHAVTVTNVSGDFELGEIVSNGAVTESYGTIGVIDINDSTGTIWIHTYDGPGFDSDDTITGADSGVTATVASVTERPANYDIRVKMVFSGTDSIEDYGVIFEVDENTQPADLTSQADNDIDTLYQDVYTNPTRDGDGEPNLSIPLETQIALLQQQITGAQISLIANQKSLTDNDTTPSVLDSEGNACGLFVIENSLATTITNFVDATSNQTIVLKFANDLTRIEHGTNIYLSGQQDWWPQEWDTLTLTYFTGIGWIEISRATKDMFYDVNYVMYLDSTGIKGRLRLSHNYIISGWSLMADSTGDIVVDLWSDYWDNYPPTNANTLPGAGNEPEIVNGDHAEGDTTAWDVDYILAGSPVFINVDSYSGMTYCTIHLKLIKAGDSSVYGI